MHWSIDIPTSSICWYYQCLSPYWSIRSLAKQIIPNSLHMPQGGFDWLVVHYCKIHRHGGFKDGLFFVDVVVKTKVNEILRRNGWSMNLMNKIKPSINWLKAGILILLICIYLLPVLMVWLFKNLIHFIERHISLNSTLQAFTGIASRIKG